MWVQATMKKIKKFPVLDGSNGWFDTSTYKGKLNSKILDENRTYDFVIIGAGVTGISAARRLAEIYPQAKIALIDALKIGQGTSGRNSGFMIDVPHFLDPNNLDIDKESKTVELNKFAIKRLKDTIEEHDLKPEWNHSGTYLAANEECNFNNIDAFIQTQKKIGSQYEVLSQSELVKRLGTHYYKKAVYTPGTVLMNPASLMMSLASVLPENIDIYEDTPLRSMQLSGEKTLQFDKANIKCDQIVFATNAFNEAVHASKNKIAPVFTYASLTRVLNSKELLNFEGIASYGVTSAHPAGTSLRFTSDNRILIRNTVNASLTSNETSLKRACEKHRLSFENRYPNIKGVPFEYSWGGILGMTLNHQSHFSETNKGVYSVAGLNGLGLAKGTYLGHYMAEFICGKSSSQLDFILKNENPSWIPPGPLTTLGANLRIRYEEYRAGMEI